MVRSIVALLASVFTAVQVFLFYIEKEGICFNAGCEIVESLTTVPPVYFNVAGFLFFQTLFWCFLRGRKGSEYWLKFAKLLLLTGMAAEAVLIFFQYAIATVFCSYCLIIFSCILFLNLACGLRQAFRATVLFCGVLLALSCLQFKQIATSGQTLDAGSCAQVTGANTDSDLYLFFSSTCPHCEEIVDSMKEENNCSVRFNPIVQIDSFQFPEAIQSPDYDYQVNLGFLKSLSINEVPVLVAKTAEGVLVYSGSKRIKKYLAEHCRGKVATLPVDVVLDYGGQSSNVEPGFTHLSSSPTTVVDDSCGVSIDCVEDVAFPSKESVEE